MKPLPRGDERAQVPDVASALSGLDQADIEDQLSALEAVEADLRAALRETGN